MQKQKEKRILYSIALHIFARKNNLITCKKIINSVNVNQRDERVRKPLHVAVICAGDKLCELLIEYGAEVNAKDSCNESLIQLAFCYGRPELKEKFLLQDLPYFG